MELLSLQQSLSEQLMKKNKVSILHSETWSVPVHTISVFYKPVVRTKMDILMKMLLMSLQNNAFESAEQLSEILLVEHLFVQDLLSKMQKTGLIVKGDSYYQLTEKGQNQFTNGVFEEEQEVTTMELLYSPTHQYFFNGDIEEVLEFEDFPEKIYRYHVQEEALNIDHSEIINEIRKTESNDEEDEDSQQEQLFITSIDSFENIQINDVPCIEFILYDEEKDYLFSRVWNTLTEDWDQQLENVIQEKEQMIWREQYLTKS